MRFPHRALLVVGMGLLAGLASSRADANCNVIPGAATEFRGALGSLDQPFASPGDRIEVTVVPADPKRCDAASPGLLANAADHLVTIVFTPPGGPASAILVSADATVPAAALASCQAALGAGRVFAVANQPLLRAANGERLAFPFPDSDAFALPNGDLRTFTGPAKIAITSELATPPCASLAAQRCANVAGLIACVDEVYEANGTCEVAKQYRHPTFGHFTALPIPNSFQALCDTPGTPCVDRTEEAPGLPRAIRFATDQDGNVLWPVSFEGVRIGGSVPIPRLVSGVSDIGAFEAGGAPVRVPGASFLGSYSPDGSRLPPVFNPFSNASGNAELFGSVDAPRGVIRIARRSPEFRECLGGTADGAACTENAQCPGATCGATSCRFTCAGGVNIGDACSANAECPGSVCGTGQATALSCSSDLQCPSGSECGPELFEFRGRQDALVGPVIVADANFDLDAQNPVPLDGLVSTDSLFLEVRAEPGEGADLNGDGDSDDAAVVTIRNRSTGDPFPIGVNDGSCGASACPGRAVARVRRLPYTFPAATAENDIVAFLEAEQLQGGDCGDPDVDCDFNGDDDDADSLLRVYRAGVGPIAGNPAASPAAQISVVPEPLVGERSLAISNGIVFYRHAELSDAKFKTTQLLAGVPSEFSEALEITPDGRHVLFYTQKASLAPVNLPGGDTNGFWDAYVHDRDSDADGILDEPGATKNVIVSIAPGPTQGNGNVRVIANAVGPPVDIVPGISANGRWVVFASNATNIGGGAGGVFLHDRDSDADGVYDESAAIATTRIAEGKMPSVSDDGRYIGFVSTLALAASDTNGVQDAYVYDRLNDFFLQIGRGPGGVQLNAATNMAILAAGGAWVAIQTSATNVANAPAPLGGVYAVSLDSTRHAIANVTTDGKVGDGLTLLSQISADGRWIGMTSFAYLGGLPASPAAYVHDRDSDDDGAFDEAGATATIPMAQGYRVSTARVTDDGRFAAVGAATATIGTATLVRLFEDLRTGLTQRLPGSLVSAIGAGPDFVVDLLGAAKGKAAVLPPFRSRYNEPFFVRGPDTVAAFPDANADGDLDDTLLYAIDTNQASPAPVLIGAAGQVEVADGRAAFLAPEAGDLDGSPGGGVRLYQNGVVVDLGASADQIALAPDWLVARVETGDARGPLVWVHPVTQPGGWTDLDLPADDFAVAGRFVAFLVPESAQVQSLNGDGDTTDRVLHFYDTQHQQLHNTGLAALDFVLAENLLAFRVSEAGQNNAILNGDGDALDAVLHVIDLAAPEAPPINAQQAAIACPFEACDGRVPYRINGETITFLTREEDQGGNALAPDCVEVDPPAGAGDCDLNGDGDASGVVLQHFNAMSMLLQAGAAPATSQFAATPAGVCTDNFESCVADANCASGSCFVAPGLCIRNTGTNCSFGGPSSCASNQFCRPNGGGAGLGTCHEIGASCEALDSCTGSFFCEDFDEDLQRLTGPVAATIADGAQLLAGSGQCLLDQGTSCLEDDDCAVSAFCSADGRCVQQTGACDAASDCTAPAACSFELISSGDFDADGDRVANSIDNCPDQSNVDQSDIDADGVGDRCDLETCGDGLQTYRETCDDGDATSGDGCSATCTIEGATPACGNGRDDDGDGAIDFPGDGGCSAASDTSERRDANDGGTSRLCDNGADDDGDLLADWPSDPGCLTPASLREDPACSDGIDSDNDGIVDAADTGCSDPSDRSESFDCNDAIDNDGDGQTDFPADAQCASIAGASEARRCANGLDDDGDGALDFPADPGCASASDDDERSATVACDNGSDDDADGVADFPADPGCASLTDGSEDAASLVCDNGVDDDADGKIDFPADPGCDSFTDTGERSAALQCDDGVDRDGDALIDLADPDCASASDPTEWSLSPGDVIVTDNQSDRVLRIRPTTGVTTTLFSGPPLLFPIGVEIDANGEIVVYDFDRNAVYRLDAASGTLGPLSLGGLIDEPRDIALEPSGALVVADAARDGIFRVNPVTGAQQLIYANTTFFAFATSLAVEADGGYLVGDFGNDTVRRVPQTGGSAAVVSSGQNFSLPRNMVIEAATGDALLVDSGTNRLIRFNPNATATTNQVIESQGQQFSAPWGIGIAADATGDVFVSDNFGRLIRVDMDLVSTANQTLLASGLGELRGLAVVPKTQCSDAVDNDGDALSDLADPDCSGPLDRTEFHLQVGDAVVTVEGPNASLVRDGTLVRVNATTGVQTKLTDDRRFGDPEGVAFDPEGRILVTDTQAKALFRFDPASGRVETVAQGGLLADPRGIDVEPAGEILLADSSSGAILRVGPESGVVAWLALAPSGKPAGVALEANGDLLVTDGSPTPTSLRRIDLPSGAATTLASGLSNAALLERNAAGNVYVAEIGANRVVEKSSVTGGTLFSSIGAFFDQPTDVAIETNGDLLVTSIRNGRIVRVDTPSGAQTILASGGLLVRPASLALVKAACSDRLDNDGDGTVDYPLDLGCTAAADTTETDGTRICDDGIYNDGDGLTDHPADSGCASVLAGREDPQCSDGIDNDGDGGIDWNGAPKDSYCTTPSRTTEKPTSCGVGAELVGVLALLRVAARRSRNG